jgi:hypothetical protein
MVADRYQNLSSQMSTFLATVELVLEVYTGSTVLGEQLGQFDDGRQSSVAVQMSVLGTCPAIKLY